MIQTHGSLCVQITEDEGSKNTRFVSVSEIDLHKVVTFVDEPADRDTSAIRTRISNAFTVPFELGTSLPLWRVEVLAGHSILFQYHHAIGDGQSGLAFHATLQQALNTLTDAEFKDSDASAIVNVPSDVKLLPPVEEQTDVSISFKGYVAAIFGTFAPKRLTKGYSAWTGNAVVDAPSLKTQVRCWTISSEEAHAVLTQCREHKTTLTGVLHTLATEVLAGLVAEVPKGKKTYKTLHTSVPVSLRRFTNASPLAMCDHVSAVHTYVPLPRPRAKTSEKPAPFPWNAASRFSARLQRDSASTREVIGTIRLLYSLGIARDYFLGSLGGKRGDTLEISNLGRFPAVDGAAAAGGEGAGAGSEPKWRISNTYFAQCDAVRGPALKLNVAGAPSGSVSFTCTWGEGAVDEALAEAFTAGVKDGLLGLGKAPET